MKVIGCISFQKVRSACGFEIVVEPTSQGEYRWMKVLRFCRCGQVGVSLRGVLAFLSCVGIGRLVDEAAERPMVVPMYCEGMNVTKPPEKRPVIGKDITVCAPAHLGIC